MLDFIKMAVARRREDRGASAVEYGLLIAAIAAVIVAIAFALGTFVNQSFTDTCNEIATSDTDPEVNCAAPAGG